MELASAQKEFVDILQRVDSTATLNQFLKWIQENWFRPEAKQIEETTTIINGQEAEEVLEKIAADVRQQLPLDAQLPSETIVFPTAGHNADCIPAITIHVDGFLYDDKLVDQLCDDGKLPKNYCRSCGSRDTQPLTFISHSASRENLAHIFKNLLPDLKGKNLLDIGSRFGAVLFGAFVYSQASNIAGVELNADLTSLSQVMVQRYNMQSRVQVHQGDILNYPQLVSSADVVIMNNVFEFFAPPPVQRELWMTIRRWIKPGALLLTCPTLEESIANLSTGIELEKWVECLNADSGAASMDNSSDTSSSEAEMDLVHLYRVL